MCRNPRPHRRAAHPEVLRHGLIQCGLCSTGPAPRTSHARGEPAGVNSPGSSTGTPTTAVPMYRVQDGPVRTSLCINLCIIYVSFMYHLCNIMHQK
ncbi:hypothetical protein T492DRAFT_915654 [Pavlovales sp. CCMP2436]|nr:hypothetical protein T492DRAFT_915654 [Pavlovales sp. CCMP2436]